MKRRRAPLRLQDICNICCMFGEPGDCLQPSRTSYSFWILSREPSVFNPGLFGTVQSYKNPNFRKKKIENYHRHRGDAFCEKNIDLGRRRFVFVSVTRLIRRREAFDRPTPRGSFFPERCGSPPISDGGTAVTVNDARTTFTIRVFKFDAFRASYTPGYDEIGTTLSFEISAPVYIHM